MQESPTLENHDVAAPEVRSVERVFAGAGVITVVVAGVASLCDLDPQLDLRAIVFGVGFGIANVRWWRTIVRALLSSNQASTGARHFFFVCNLAFKVSLLLLVIYGLSRLGREVTRSFLMGFVGFLTLGGLILFIIGRRLTSAVDAAAPNK